MEWLYISWCVCACARVCGLSSVFSRDIWLLSLFFYRWISFLFQDLACVLVSVGELLFVSLLVR
jgi:hypothetical protein